MPVGTAEVTSGRSGCGQELQTGVPSRMMFALLIIGSVVAGGVGLAASTRSGRGGHPRHLQLRPGLCDGRFRRRRYRFGVDGYYGSMPGGSLSAPVVGGAATENQGGYWEVGSDGAIYNFGVMPASTEARPIGNVPSNECQNTVFLKNLIDKGRCDSQNAASPQRGCVNDASEGKEQHQSSDSALIAGASAHTNRSGTETGTTGMHVRGSSAPRRRIVSRGRSLSLMVGVVLAELGCEHRPRPVDSRRWSVQIWSGGHPAHSERGARRSGASTGATGTAPRSTTKGGTGGTKHSGGAVTTGGIQPEGLKRAVVSRGTPTTSGSPTSTMPALHGSLVGQRLGGGVFAQRTGQVPFYGSLTAETMPGRPD